MSEFEVLTRKRLLKSARIKNAAAPQKAGQHEMDTHVFTTILNGTMANDRHMTNDLNGLNESQSCDSNSGQTLHKSVLLDEALEWWCSATARNTGVFIDCTFGRGGHSRALLQQTSVKQLIVFDKDPAAITTAQQLHDELKTANVATDFMIAHRSFAELQAVANDLDVAGKVNGILMDLGVSSPQLDEAARGFSFMKDGPLDMRMDFSKGLTAAQWLAEVDEKTLADVIYQYGEEKQSRRIARKIIEARAVKSLATTAELADLVCQVVPRRVVGKHPATRTFQAIRMFINAELDDLRQGLDAAFQVLAPGGRLVVLSFHSLEDRIVKQFMNGIAKPAILPRGLPIRADQIAPAAKLCLKAQKPQTAEVAVNPRARSAILRVIEKV